MAVYRAVLSLPGVARLLIFAVFARVPITAAGVVLTLHVVVTKGLGYAAAGWVATAVTVGMALGAPWRGRAVDRFGLRRALAPSVVAEAGMWGMAPFVGYRMLLVVAFFGGLLALPTFTVVRQSLSVLVPESERRAAFALDSMGTEISFIIGPAGGVLVATQVSTTVGLLAVGACAVGAGLALIAFNPPTRTTPGQTVNRTPDRFAWVSPGLIAVLGATMAATLVLSGTEVGVVAHLRQHDAIELTGLIYLAWGVASIAGGIVYGAARRQVSPFTLLLGLAALTVPVGLAPTPFTLALAILPAAALCAPLISSTGEAISRLVPETVRGEALGWHGSALTFGGAFGAPLAGAMIDSSGAWAGFAVVGVVGFGLAVAGLALQRRRATRSESVVADSSPAMRAW